MKAANILDTIGDTPLVRLSRIGAGLTPQIVAKLELFNPGGSIKDRVAIRLIEAAEQDGRLKPGGTIIEPTSGNTGVGLAMVAAVKGYKLVLVMPESMSIERRRLMLAYGARACRAWFARTLAWRVLDCFVAVMMLGFAVRFAIDALQASAAR